MRGRNTQMRHVRRTRRRKARQHAALDNFLASDAEGAPRLAAMVRHLPEEQRHEAMWEKLGRLSKQMLVEHHKRGKMVFAAGVAL